jgi:hypothetical protein
MLRRTTGCLAAVLAILSLSAAAAQAQVTQSVSLNLGYFVSPAEDARQTNDVIVQNLNFLLFDPSDFNGASIGGDYLIGFGQYLEAGVGVGYHRRTVPTVYADFVDSDGTEIFQEMKLRITPIALTMRFLPLGNRSAVQPYVGAGVGLFSWRYAETGEFVDFRDDTIFRASYVDTGMEVGVVALGGVRLPIGDAFGAGVEIVYHNAKGGLDPSVGFLGDTVDLGGWTTQVTFQVKF